MKVIYQGGYIPDLAVDIDINSRTYGWLCYRHPDEKWITLVDIRYIFPNIPITEQRLAVLERRLQDLENLLGQIMHNRKS